ncbi:MAG: hypothetical protein ABR573_03760 [Candidatus Dormibacteria bacterium]
MALAACGSTGGQPSPGRSGNPGPALQVIALSAPSDQCAPCVVVGADRRFAMAVTDRDGVPVPGAAVKAQLFRVPAGNAPAEPLGPAIEAPYRGELLQDKGVYVLHQSFDRPGIYKVVVDAQKGSVSARSEANFQVIATDPGIAVGQPAPLSHGPLATEVKDISTIDTGQPPDDMHYTTIADAIASHHPVVAFFGSPGFCQSKTCAPEVEVVKALEAKYRSRGVDFVHVETFKGGRPDSAKTVNPEFDQWKLTTDPWVIVVDRAGRVSAKFDGPATAGEIDPSVAPLAT